MSIEIDSYEAKAKLLKILRRVESGETFTITNRGKVIADLVPSKSVSRAKAKLAIDNLLKIKKIEVSNKVLAELREVGRK
jgi:prevent-host-death family protein